MTRKGMESVERSGRAVELPELHARLQERQHFRFMLAQRRSMRPAFLPYALRQRRQHGALEVRLEQRRMDVVLATYGARVAESLGGAVDGAQHVLLRVALRRRGSHLAQR